MWPRRVTWSLEVLAARQKRRRRVGTRHLMGRVIIGWMWRKCIFKSVNFVNFRRIGMALVLAWQKLMIFTSIHTFTVPFLESHVAERANTRFAPTPTAVLRKRPHFLRVCARGFEDWKGK